MSLIRLDKYLASSGLGSRTDVKNAISKGLVAIDGKPVKKADIKFDPEKTIVTYSSNPVIYEKYVYFMLNKPNGVVSATEDKTDKTVIDLISEEDRRKGIFPVGRLDKDTEGLLIITNDGGFSHNTLSPKKHVEKEYYAKIKGIADNKDINALAEGIIIDKDTKCLPSKLEIISTDNAEVTSEIKITINEGKFHQIKRMFHTLDKEVIYLKRIRFGEIVLDEDLSPGEYRKLTEKELHYIKEKR
ncbi:MAG: rRNA pseudouridine synthase [Firmicutes bacterium]|nr:rRNA pseudouridine synthase [Bacillota bacterium]